MLQGFTASSGPMNISNSRSESAPYSFTTSSGLMTLPRAFDILWARASTRTYGTSFRTKTSPLFSTWLSFRATVVVVVVVVLLVVVGIVVVVVVVVLLVSTSSAGYTH